MSKKIRFLCVLCVLGGFELIREIGFKNQMKTAEDAEDAENK